MQEPPAVDARGDLVEVPEDLVTECRHTQAHYTERLLAAGGVTETWVICAECDQPLFLLEG